MVLFGQVVVGPPGSGKTTYCHGMSMFVKELGRSCEIVNLDFANDVLPYRPAVDVRDLISLQDTMEEHKLGPNGGLLYCMEYLLENIEWLEERIKELKTNYIIFDCPGQVELYTHHTGFKTILDKLSRSLDARLCSVHLVDSFYCCQPATFISAVLLVTSTMLRLGLPHVNVLTKVDLLRMYGKLPFSLDFFTECMNLAPLLRYLDAEVPDIPAAKPSARQHEEVGSDESDREECEPPAAEASGRSKLQQKFYRMSSALVEVVDDYGLVSFHPMNVEDVETVGRVLAATDTANGFSLASYEATEWAKRQRASQQQEPGNSSRAGGGGGAGDSSRNQASNYDLFRLAARNLDSDYSYSLDIQEKYGLL